MLPGQLLCTCDSGYYGNNCEHKSSAEQKCDHALKDGCDNYLRYRKENPDYDAWFEAEKKKNPAFPDIRTFGGDSCFCGWKVPSEWDTHVVNGKEVQRTSSFLVCEHREVGNVVCNHKADSTQ